MSKDLSKFIQLQKELKGYLELMGNASDTIIHENVSNYPIFVVHQQEVEIGIPIAEKGKVQGNWSINASSMEEFMSKNIIEDIKVDSFKTIFKNPEEHYCIFVLSELGANFIFLPRTENQD